MIRPPAWARKAAFLKISVNSYRGKHETKNSVPGTESVIS